MNISIVIPIYRDTDALPELLDQLFMIAIEHRYDTNVILVDDGSQNDTWQKLVDIKKSLTSEKIMLLRLTHNCGQQAATICGLTHCNSEIAITMDSDLQHSPTMIPIMLEEMSYKNSDVIYGVPEKNHQPLLRRVSSFMFKTLTQPLSSSAVPSSSFRVIRTSITDNLHEQIWKPGHSIDVFLKSKTHLIQGIKISHAARRHGVSTYTWKALFIRAIKDLYYSGRSGTVYILAGVSVIAVGILEALQKAAANQPHSAALTTESIYFFTSGIMLIFWGRHLSNTGTHNSQYPIFTIAEKID